LVDQTHPPTLSNANNMRAERVEALLFVMASCLEVNQVTRGINSLEKKHEAVPKEYLAAFTAKEYAGGFLPNPMRLLRLKKQIFQKHA
jgi:hypothetical protein